MSSAENEQPWGEVLRSYAMKAYLLARFLAWQTLHFIFYSLKVVKRAKLNYLLGFSACFLVVTVIAVVDTSLAMAPVVFLRIAEAGNGEIDLTLNAGKWTGYQMLDYNQISELLDDNYTLSFHAPRITIPNTNLYLDSDCSRGVGEEPSSLDWKYTGIDSNPNVTNRACKKKENTPTGCFLERCPSVLTSVELFIIDQEREKKMGVGRNYTLPPAKKGEIYLLQAVQRSLGVTTGDLLYVEIDLRKDFLSIAQYMTNYNGTENRTTVVYLPMRVGDNQGRLDSPQGKFAISQTSAGIIDMTNFWEQVLENLNPTASVQAKERMNEIDIYSWVKTVIVNLPPPREFPYLSSSYDDIQRNVTGWASQVLYKAGFHTVSSDMPVLSGMFTTNLLALFLGLILNIIITVLVILSILLIYSLMLISVETRTFEMGVLRMIGLSRLGVVELLLIQAMLYAVPAVVCGLAVAQAITAGLGLVFTLLTAVVVNPFLRAQSVALAGSLGIFIPVIASILPIRAALGQNVHDSLDTSHSKTQAVKVTIERSEDNRIPWTIIVIGGVMAGFGFLIYYLFPLALLSFNLTLLLYIFFGLILGMLLGLVMLSLNVEQMLERLVLVVFFFWEKTAITAVVLKNLTAHRERNRKTTIMYSLSLGFIIFMSVSFQLQTISFTYELQQRNGAFMKVTTGSSWSTPRVAQPILFPERFEAVCRKHSICRGYAWTTAPLTSSTELMESSQIQNLGRVFSSSARVFGISSNYFDATIDGFLNRHGDDDPLVRLSRIPAPWDAPPPNLDEGLYTVLGSYRALLGTALIDLLALNQSSHFIMKTNFGTLPLPLRNLDRMSPYAFLDTAPGFRFSKFPAVRNQDSVVSFPTFLRLSDGRIKSVQDIPLQNFLLDLSPASSEAQKNKLNAELSAVAKNISSSIKVWDYRNYLQPIEIAQTIMLYFFVFTLAIAMVTCFFSLVASMYANILEQSKEIGVIRALGIQKFWIVRIYLYEAFVLIVASSLLGLLIGTFVGWTMTMQRALFTQLPLPFIFPWQLMCTIIMFSMVFSVLATVLPTVSLLKKPVVTIMRTVT